MEELKGMFGGKKVVEIGCGHGLLAVAAGKLKAKEIIVQDYNRNVIEELTKPTLVVNGVECPVEYLWGDWDTMAVGEDDQRYDIILGSELTYRE